MTQEAFKAWWYNEGSQTPYTHHDCEEHTMRMCEIAWNKAQSLAQPEQEPVVHDPLPRACNLAGVDYLTFLKIKAYMPVAPPQPEQEPVIGRWRLREVYFDEDGEPISHRSPPQRKPLTDEEIDKLLGPFPRYADKWLMTDFIRFARAIEAAHGIKE